MSIRVSYISKRTISWLLSEDIVRYLFRNFTPDRKPPAVPLSVKRTAAEYYLSKARYSPSRSILLPRQSDFPVHRQIDLPVHRQIDVPVQSRQPQVGFGSTAPRFSGLQSGFVSYCILKIRMLSMSNDSTKHWWDLTILLAHKVTSILTQSVSATYLLVCTITVVLCLPVNSQLLFPVKDPQYPHKINRRNACTKLLMDKMFKSGLQPNSWLFGLTNNICK